MAKNNAISLISNSGRYGSTYAHIDIAFEFASWVSVELKLYLKAEEQGLPGWSAKQEQAKLNYQIHTDAIKPSLILPEIAHKKVSVVHASEVDVLNAAMFGMTAREWRSASPDKKGNIWNYANISELIYFTNMEAINSEYINDQIPQAERLMKLNRIAISQMQILSEVSGRKLLADAQDEEK